ncbi:hypothetical protein FGG08_001852 [Glutinoglossum americanum]|uniref:Mitochondrial resolvase Ydc2 catalytic domain-containing protein n=1 Tax=Glutinoglossum americanum TaxID=1670608 RepID=A0A9P8I5Z2_9PEZI|nr:hypothetical protein FGG08_001852 [Glutinoglossum americanum]
MAVHTSALQALKLVQLKNIAVKCGINSSGTKSILASRIFSEIAVTNPPFPEDAIPIATATVTPSSIAAKQNKQKTIGHSSRATRVLSIDMGIRNLAYCILDNPSWKKHTKSTIPSLIAWKRIAISPRPHASPLDSAKETFEPQAYASLAYLLTQTLLSYRPTLVLIERQRYRSAGSSAVQEWTVRVNMFEGMLYAVLHTLQVEGRWSGLVRGVAPGKVGAFWVKGTGNGTAKTSRTAKWRNKTAKIDLVGKWLETGGSGVLTMYTDESNQTAEAFLERWKGRKKGKRSVLQRADDTDVATKEGAGEKLHKLDDLADCLLQGLAWIRWEENKLKILAGGVTALEELVI